MSKFNVPIFNTFRERHGRVGLGWFIILNDLPSTKMVVKIYLTQTFNVDNVNEYQ